MTEELRYNPAQGLKVMREIDYEPDPWVPGTIRITADHAVWLARALLIAAHGRHDVVILPTQYNPDA